MLQSTHSGGGHPYLHLEATVSLPTTLGTINTQRRIAFRRAFRFRMLVLNRRMSLCLFLPHSIPANGAQITVHVDCNYACGVVQLKVDGNEWRDWVLDSNGTWSFDVRGWMTPLLSPGMPFDSSALLRKWNIRTQPIASSSNANHRNAIGGMHIDNHSLESE